MLNNIQLFNEIDKLKNDLDKKRPLPKEVVNNLRDHLIVEWTYHSNGIEGNTLTLTETKVILEDGITIGGKSMREHLEAINHKEAISFIEDLVKDDTPINQQTIKDIHAIILRGIDTEGAGVYRKVKVLISGAEHVPPNPLVLEDEMNALIDWYENTTVHPIERAALLHSFFVKIYPFIDGNGRTARLLLNLDLMKSGYLPIVLRKEKRLQYYEALDQSHVKKEFTPFVNMVGESLKHRMKYILEFLE
jgi:Fic family protein